MFCSYFYIKNVYLNVQNADIDWSSRASAVALQWYGPVVIPMAHIKFCISPEPKLLNQSTPNFERLITSVI